MAEATLSTVGLGVTVVVGLAGILVLITIRVTAGSVEVGGT